MLNGVVPCMAVVLSGEFYHNMEYDETICDSMNLRNL